MIKKILLMSCMSFSIIHAERRLCYVFPTVLSLSMMSEIFVSLRILGLENTKKMICDNKLKVAGWVAFKSVLLYQCSHFWVTFGNELDK